MVRIPSLRASNPDDDDPPRRLGRAGLDALMRDGRYWDPNAPDHDRFVETVRRGFEMVFSPPRPRTTPGIAGQISTPVTVTDPDGAFARSLSRLLTPDQDVDVLPTAARETLGRRAILHALRGGGFTLPPGLDDSDDALSLKTAPASAATTIRPNAEDNRNASFTPTRSLSQKTTASAREPGRIRETDTGERDSSYPPAAQTAQVPEAKPDPSLNLTKPTGVVPRAKWADPLPTSPISPEFRQALHERESSKGNYQAENEGAWGRYQLTKPARQQIRLEDKNGIFTGKYGVHSKEDFLKNAEAQERAFADYVESNERQLRANGAKDTIGETIDGIKGKIVISDSGLAAAAHRHGPAGVHQYLEYLQTRGWKSDIHRLPESPTKKKMLAIETRLREFQDIPYRSQTPNR